MELTKEEKVLKRWRLSPEKFVREAIGAEPSNQQVQLLTLVGEMGNAKVKSFDKQPLTERERELARKIGIAVKSGHGTGKDTCLSWIYMWLLTVFPFSRGMVTAPTAPQLRQILWSEFSKWIRKSPILSESLVIETELVFQKDNKKEWFVSARTANPNSSEDEQAETLAGQHSDFLIVAADESSGIPKAVFKPLEGALTGVMNFAILIGNPTRSNGYFFDVFNSDKERWETLSWNSEESSIVSPDYISRMESKYGRDSNMFRIRVTGDFPITDSTSLIPYSWVMSAADRELEVPQGSYCLKGIDVGGGGDKTICLTRKGNVVTDIRQYDSADTMQVVGWIMRELSFEDYDMAFIDPVGLGAGVYDRLKELRVDNLYPVDVRMESSNPACFRLRDELFWRLREQFERGTIKIPDDEELIGELTTIKYGDTDRTKGLIKIESKFDMRKRGVESPNKADALSLTYFFGDSSYKSIGRPLTRKAKPVAMNWKVL